MDYTADVWGKKEQDQDAGVRDWLKSFYSGKQDAEDIEITPELRERYNRYADAAAKQYVAEAPPNESNNETLGQSVLQNVTKAGLGLFDLLQRSGRFLNPYLAGPVQEAARHNLSQELGYGIAGAEELEKEKGLPPGLAQKIIAATSQMAVDIPAKYMNPLWGGVMIAEGALGGLDRGRTAEDIARQIGEDRGGFVPQDTRTTGEKLIDVAKGAGEGAVSAATLKGLGTVGKLAPGYARPLIEGGGFAGMAAAPALSGEPVDINDIISNALIGGFFGLKKRNEPRKTLGDFKKYVSEKLGRKLTLDENVAVSRAGLGALEEKPNATQTEPNAEQLIARAKRAAELSELQKKAQAEFGEAPKAATTIGQGAANRAPSSPATAQTEAPAPVDMAKPEIAPREALTQEKPVVEKSVEKPVEPKVEITTGKELAKQLPPSRGVEVDPSMPDGASLESGGAGKGVGRNKFVELEKVGEGWKPATFVTQEGDVGVGRVIPDGQKTRPRITLERDPQTNKIVESVFKTEVTDPAMLEAFRMAESGGAEKPAGEISVGETFGEQFKTGKFAQKPADMKVEQPEDINALKEYAANVGKDKNIVGVKLVGSHVRGGGKDVDIVYDFGDVKIPKDSAAAVAKIEGLIESSDNMNLDLYDTFIKVGDRYFHVQGGAGREVIENTAYGKDQAGKPEVSLFSRAAQPEAVKTELPPGEPPKPPPSGKPYEPVMRESGPAKDVLKKAIEDGLADPENPWKVTEYESANKKEFAERTVDYIGDDINRGWDVIEGKTQPPPGTSNSSFFLAMREYVNKSGDGTLLMRFSKSIGLTKISEAGSALGQLSGYKAEETPVDAVIEIEKARKKHAEEIRETPYLKDVLEKRLLKAQDRLAEAMARHEREIEQLKAIWQRKRLDRYAKRLGKKELTLTEKIKAGDFTKDPQYKIWLDQQTRRTKNNVSQLQKTFNKLKEIADRRETGVSDTEAQELMNRYEDMRQKKLDMENGRDGMPYGRAYVDFHEYKSELMFRATKMTVGEALRMPGKTASKIAGISKAIKAAFDNSFIFRQGFKTLVTHPKIWLDNSTKSFKWAVQQYGGKHVMRELMADIVSRPNFMNGKMERAKLSFGNPEEPFPTSIPEKIWFFGKIYKASETAFAGQAYKTRADLFDKFMDVPVGNKKMVDIADKKKLESIGKLVNSLTGRGYIGKVTKEQGEFVNNVFFSLRFLKSNFDFLTAHQFQKGVDPFVRKEAAKNLLSATISTAAVLAVANALRPGSVEWDSRSADFGKIRIGNTRFDVTGGMGSLIILASRMIQGSTKSSVSGKISKGTGIFGDPMDYVYNFFEGKLSPVASTAVALVKRKDYRTRKPPTISDVLRRTVAPLPVENAEELLRDPKSADFLLSLILDGLGVGTNTYGAPNKKGNPSRPVGGFDYTVK